MRRETASVRFRDVSSKAFALAQRSSARSRFRALFSRPPRFRLRLPDDGRDGKLVDLDAIAPQVNRDRNLVGIAPGVVIDRQVALFFGIVAAGKDLLRDGPVFRKPDANDGPFDLREVLEQSVDRLGAAGKVQDRMGIDEVPAGKFLLVALERLLDCPGDGVMLAV